MSLWKILIEGLTPLDVQGVNLRESVVMLANQMGIKCIVKNRKGTKIVEVVCKCEDEDEAKTFKNKMSKIPEENPLVKLDRLTINEPQMYVDPAIREESVNGFEIEREDDLTEMVWALQNAGKTLLLQEKLKTDSLFRAIRAEIETFQDVINKIDTGNPYQECFVVVAIEGFLRNPPKKSEDLTAKLHGLYRYAKTINDMIVSEKSKNEMPLDDVRKLLQEIKEVMGGLDLNA